MTENGKEAGTESETEQFRMIHCDEAAFMQSLARRMHINEMQIEKLSRMNGSIRAQLNWRIHHVKLGVIVTSRGNEYRVCEISPMCNRSVHDITTGNKPYVVGNPRKKDSPFFAETRRHLFGEWEFLRETA
jgi:hypothetical protein